MVPGVNSTGAYVSHILETESIIDFKKLKDGGHPSR